MRTMAKWLPVVGVLLVAGGAARGAGVYTFSDAEMMHLVEVQWGTSAVAVLDVPGVGVRFDLDLADTGDGKTGTKDDWPVHSDAGLGYDAGWYPNDPNLPHAQAHNNVSIAAWGRVEMKATVLSGPAGGGVDLHLFLTTGMTGPSAYPSNDLTNDTFWGGDWVTVPVGGSAVLTMDFADCQAWNLADNKYPHTGGGLAWADGGRYAINARDLREVTAIGLEFADFDGDLGGAPVQVLLTPVPEPATLALLLTGAALLGRRPARKTHA